VYGGTQSLRRILKRMCDEEKGRPENRGARKEMGSGLALCAESSCFAHLGRDSNSGFRGRAGSG